MNKSINKWRESGDYLPDFLKDFHDQKDFFKAMHELINVEGHEFCKDITWVGGHCYVIDIFLWFLAKYGYKIQKSTAKVDFKDIYEEIKYCNEIRIRKFGNILMER